MPHYDYECQKCGYVFEAFQKMNDAPLKTCPKCQGPLKKLIGAGSGLIFKGSGFYITDYKKKNTQSTSSAKSSASTNSSGSSSTENKKPKTNAA